MVVQRHSHFTVFNIQNEGFSSVPAPTHGSRSPLFLNWRIRSEKYIAAVVSSRNLPVNQQNRLEKAEVARLKGTEIYSVFRPRLVFRQLFIHSFPAAEPVRISVSAEIRSEISFWFHLF